MNQRPPTRTHTSYDPFADLRSLGWTIRLCHLSDDAEEQYDRSTRTVFMDPAAYVDDPQHAVAHACGHIRYDLDQLGDTMTVLQEANANSYAYLWLDREWAL